MSYQQDSFDTYMGNLEPFIIEQFKLAVKLDYEEIKAQQLRYLLI